MKKIISLFLTLTLLCSIGITALATNNETVGGKITLTQFIGTERNNATSVQLYIKGQLYTVDTKAFYDIADSMIITSNIEPYTITNDGIYICVKADEDTADFVYLSDAGIDRATPAPGRPLYSLYVPDDATLINKIISLTEQKSDIINSEWAVGEISKANELKIIPNDFAVTDYTQPITRENFCILAVKMIETKIGEELATENPQFPLGISDINNENVDKLYAAGIINGKEQKKTGIIFAPYDLITREEAATILNRIAVYLGMDMPQIIDAVYYWDESNISDWAIDAVKTMRQFGIMEGVNGYEFYPKGTYTVEQAIATMVRLYDKIKLEWEAAFNYSDFNKANHGEGENFQRNSGIEYISGKAVKTIYDDYTLTGDNLNHLSWAKIGYDDYYGGLYLGISMIAHHLIADDEFSSLCSEMVTNMYDGTSVKDNADFANEHFTISINGTPVKIKAVGMGKGNGHHDYYFALDTDINRYDINEIDFECKL